jgi:predicted nucleotidyltransferase component of viral defense system
VKEEALALIRGEDDAGRALNRLREYLQALVLRTLFECEAFRPLALMGGTALRLLHGLPRFSEDLDFSLVTPGGYAGAAWMGKVKRDLALAGFDPEVTWNDRRTVHTAWVRLGGLLGEAGLSARREAKLAIKLEIDTRPPDGASVERRVLTHHVTFLLQHYDAPSLFAGKLHALIARRYAKGRDWYDLLWYLSHRPAVAPNVPMLQNALDQTHGPRGFDAASWPDLVRRRLHALDIDGIRRDVAPFLERPADASLLTKENLAHLLPE